MAGRASKNNFLAGVFILGTLLAGVAMLIWIGNAFDSFTRRTDYVLRFNIRDGASGLKNDSVVRVGGQPVGTVATVSFERPSRALSADAGTLPAGSAEAGDNQPSIYVTIRVLSSVTLHRNAKVYLELPLLGSVSTINIPDVGGPRPGATADAAEVLPPWGVLDATLAPPTFLSQAGYGDEQRDQMQRIFKRADEITERVQSIATTVDTRLPKTMDGVDASIDNVKVLTGDVRRRWQEAWAEQVDVIMKNVRVGSVTLSDAVSDGRKFVASIQDAVNANRPLLDKIFLNASELAEKVNTDLYGRVVAVMDEGQKAVRDVADITARARQMVIEESPGLRRALADARLAADQLKLTLIEVRRNPWRLLYQPTRKELAEELLYDSARSYAEAVADLRSSGEALQGLLAAQRAGTVATATDKARIEELTAEVQAALERYKATEQRFTDLVLRGAQK
jgi:putative NIF3 family GTP cyclohydrolase 1 type 2